MQFEFFTREVSSDELESFTSTLAAGEAGVSTIPYSVARASVNGQRHRSFKLSDGEDTLTVCAQTIHPTTTVNPSEPEQVEVGYCVMDEEAETAWYVEPEAVSDFDVLPKVHQAFYKGDFYDRDSDYEYVYEDESFVAAPATDPVRRLEEEVVFTELILVNGIGTPYEWYARSESGDVFYLRERSGHIQVRRETIEDDEIVSEQVFDAYVGREHPGTSLHKYEIMNIISSVDYFSFADEPSELPDVPDEVLEEFTPDYEELYDDISESDYEDLFAQDVELDEEEEDFYDGEVKTFQPKDNDE